MEDVIKKLDEMASEAKAAREGVTAEFTKGIEAVQGEIKVVKDQAEKLEEQFAEFRKAQSKFQAENGRAKSLRESIGEALEQKADELKNYNNLRKQGITLKAVGNMGSSNLTTTGTETFVGAQQVGGVGRKPYEMSHIRDLARVINISSDAGYAIRDAAGEGGPTAVAMAAAKPQSDRDYVKLIQPVTKIAHYFKIPEEMLTDLGWLQNEIAEVGVEELLAKEDDLVLNQVGGAGAFAGLTTATNSTAFAAPAGLALNVVSPNNYDVLVSSWTQLRNLKTSATAAVCSPAEYAAMVLAKATTGEYAFGAPNVQIPNVFGVPLVPHTSITGDKFLIGDFSKVTIGQRAGISVRFYDQNEDDAIKNMVTVVIEERLTVVVDRADRLIYGDFSDARTALLKP